MKRICIRALTLLLAVSMLFMTACGGEKGSEKPKTTTTTKQPTVGESTSTTAVNSTETTVISETSVSASSVTTTTTTGSSTIAPTAVATKSSVVLTKPTQTGTTAVKPTDPTAAFLAEFEGWLENLFEYQVSSPKVVKLKDGFITSYTFTEAKFTADYCVHIRSMTDGSVDDVYVTVKAQDYDYMFPVICYYVYNSLGLAKMDSDAFCAQFDAFPDVVDVKNKAEGSYHMTCVKPDEFMSFVFSKSSERSAESARILMQLSECGGCYADTNRSLNYLALTDAAIALGYDISMMDRALVSAGNRVRIANVMRRALNGEEITIGYIGGSVTEGAYASDYNKTSYAGLSYAWWVKTFPQAKFNFVKAGVGGTSSLFGVHRVQEDLLKYNPDFVIVEYAVNDCSHSYQTEAYANLIHRILTYGSEPAVMQLYVMNEDGSNAQALQEPIGKHYDLPQISYRDAVYPEVKNGNILWAEIGKDSVHPTNQGHAMIAELIISYLTKTYADLDAIGATAPAVPKPYMPYVYEHAIYYHKNNFEPLSMNGFKQVSNKNCSWMGSGKSSITFEFTGKQCILAIPTTYKDGLDVSIRIDGGESVTLPAYIFYGGAFANAVVFNGEEGKHTIEIICNSGMLYIGGLFVS